MGSNGLRGTHVSKMTPMKMVNRVPHLSHPARNVASGETTKADVPCSSQQPQSGKTRHDARTAHTYGQGEPADEGIS